MDQTPVLHATGAGAPAASQLNRKFGFWLFLASELLIFCGLMGAFLVTRHYAPSWPGRGTLSIGLVSLNTFLLLTSSLTVVLGIENIRLNRSRNLVLFILASALLGVLFLCGQAYEWTHLIAGEHYSFAVPFGSAFFTLTGLHGLHVFVGVLWAVAVALRARSGAFSARNYTTVEMFGLYWHFVDLVWILIFTVVYLI